MFYSQFILAKKGPLGTIWIAAHLERKLRKNQVADTDIGVSVDSILSPDVPIALRLSSHLLVGVVRIYNRKVNYLFDDCSDALLKVKQAFRSTTVDLPPEESKAPYHSITLPETFDLDDFELPDNDIFQGNYHGHHISSREQITLQDNMEGVSYSTSKFGLDERFGDGDASGLDLDEELLLENVGAAGNTNESSEPHASVASMSTLKQDEHTEDRAADPTDMVGGIGEYNDQMDYAEGPCTPGLVEEPNISNVKEVSACDDQTESEYHLESTVKDNSKDISFADKQEVQWSSHDNTVPQEMPEENPCQPFVLEISEPTAPGESQARVDTEYISLKEPSSVPESGQIEALKTSFESADTLIMESTAPSVEYLQTEAANEVQDHQGVDELAKENGPENSGLASTFQQVDEGISAVDPSSAAGKYGTVEDTNMQQKVSPSLSELTSENQFGQLMENTDSQALCKSTNISTMNHDAHDNEAITETPVLRPCTTVLEQSGEDVCVIGNLDTNQVQESVSVEFHHVASNEVAGQVNNTNTQDEPVENVNMSVDAELSAPEKLLSLPEGHSNLHGNMLEEFSPGVFLGQDEGDAGSKTLTGKKRTFTESTLTEQSLNSVESSRQVRVKRTIDSVPDDDDLLSSILVGRKSSLFKVKPTPRLSEVTSMKRARSAPRSTAPKRKLVIDETMVLHGDTIRQQLTNTDDIRRVRKKAPCTCSEISMIHKQYMEDQIFLETLFTGMSVELTSLHHQEYDLSRINVCQNKETRPSLEISVDPAVPLETMTEPKLVDDDGPVETAGDHVEERVEVPEGTGEREQNQLGENNEHLSANDNEMIEPREDPVLSENRLEGAGVTGEREQSEVGVHNEHLSANDNEIIEPRETAILSESGLEEVHCTSTEVNNFQEKIKDSEMSAQEICADAAELVTSSLNADVVDAAGQEGVVSSGFIEHKIGDTAYASDDLVHIASLDETVETNYCVNVNDVPSADLETANVNDGQITGRDGVSEKDGDVNGECETEHGTMDILANVDLSGGAVELGPSIEQGELEYNVLNEIYTALPEEQNMQSSLLEDEFLRNGEDVIYPVPFQSNLVGAEISGFDLHERDEINYSATGDDTEFLNFDDEDMAEMADEDDMPDDGETRNTENSGWSSRTRAVSKYLQTAFIKEAAYGSKSLSMDNLLNCKTRKEASRMFFETLVLKTRDYIDVEQPHAFDDIIIKPRSKLMKSDF